MRTVFPTQLTDLRAFDIAQALLDGFNRHYTLFRAASAAAKQRFERADWHGQQRAQRERIEFYDRRVDENVERLQREFDIAHLSMDSWQQVKLHYIGLLADRLPDAGLSGRARFLKWALAGCYAALVVLGLAVLLVVEGIPEADLFRLELGEPLAHEGLVAQEPEAAGLMLGKNLGQCRIAEKLFQVALGFPVLFVEHAQPYAMTEGLSPQPPLRGCAATRGRKIFLLVFRANRAKNKLFSISPPSREGGEKGVGGCPKGRNGCFNAISLRSDSSNLIKQSSSKEKGPYGPISNLSRVSLFDNGRR